MSAHKQKFHTRIIKLFLLLISIMVSLQILTLYVGASSIVSRLTNELSGHLSARVMQQFSSLREQPSAQVRVIGRFLQNDPQTRGMLGMPAPRLLKLMKLELAQNAYLSSLYLADADGNFLQLTRIPRLASRRILRQAGQPVEENWDYLDASFNSIEQRKIPSDYDPRLRPWYLNTKAEPMAQLTKPYLFSSSRLPGVTISYPVLDEQGDIVQIVAADITLDSISEFLQQIKATENSLTYLIERNGTIIANSSEDSLAVSDPENGITRLKRLDELESSLPQQALQTYLERNEVQFSLPDGGEQILVRVKPGQAEGILLLTLIPESDLHGPVFELITRSFLIFLGITLLATLAVFWVSRNISRPILLLSKEVGHIKEFTLDEYKGVDTRITEISEMNDSLESAVDALKSFQKYVPRELVKNIIQNEETAEIGGREIEITLMFTDIENFTTISEQLPPHQLMEQLSEYFDALTGIISASGGTIDKYIGDAVMAFWGAPSAIEDSAGAACRAALACQQRLDTLNAKWLAEGRPVMPTRIGVHSGRAIVGNVGSRDHINYTAVGDSVNVASRLEGLNKQFNTRILISEATYLQVRTSIECKEMGEVQVKGRQQAVKVYQPLRLKA